MQYTTIFTKEDNGWYTVEVLELPGCVSYWDSLEEAEDMIKDAIHAYIKSVNKHEKSSISDVKKRFISSVNINDSIQA